MKDYIKILSDLHDEMVDIICRSGDYRSKNYLLKDNVLYSINVRGDKMLPLIIATLTNEALATIIEELIKPENIC